VDQPGQEDLLRMPRSDWMEELDSSDRPPEASAGVCIEFWAFVGGDLESPDMALDRSLRWDRPLR
jgi:hypothetical protein